MVDCPKCNSTNVSKVKEWDVKPKTKKGPTLHITLYACQNCNNKFRVAVKA
ncbi:MAG: hypothetical protein ABIH76_03935 [Candidatus Bathyarchaeota archaeon]